MGLLGRICRTTQALRCCDVRDRAIAKEHAHLAKDAQRLAELIVSLDTALHESPEVVHDWFERNGSELMSLDLGSPSRMMQGKELNDHIIEKLKGGRP